VGFIHKLKIKNFKLNLSKFEGVVFFSFLFFPTKCWADILPPPIWAPFYYTLLSFGINLIANAFFLVIVYLILKKKKLIISLKFLKYLLFVTFGGFLIDLIYIIPKLSSVTFITITPITFLLTICGIGFYNYWLSRKIFNLNKKEAIFVGLVAVIFGSPISPLTHLPLISPLFSMMGL